MPDLQDDFPTEGTSKWGTFAGDRLVLPADNRYHEMYVGWAVECCGEHLYSAEEQRIHDETYHREEKS